jgi:acyl transferase domain-containing protein/NAD(P)H-dependent flavin oxidoreductase YrpB (nitropropane dioxygenase family)/NAD(P)-dependent dehydrogenase (short-subunit alcohol dehydrogenase family)
VNLCKNVYPLAYYEIGWDNLFLNLFRRIKLMQTFQVIILTLPGLPEPSVAIAASRAGGLGVLDLEYTCDEQTALDAIQKLIKYSRSDVGLKLNSRTKEFFSKITSDLPEQIKTVILTRGQEEIIQEQVEVLHRQGVKVLLEATCLNIAQIGEQLGVDGIIAKGNESGGRIEEETTYVLLQRFLKNITLPIYAHGGVGLHTAAACYVAGAAGVVLDSQLSLTKESSLPESVKKKIALMDGSETICIGETIGETYRIHARPSTQAIEELKQIEKQIEGKGARGQEGEDTRNYPEHRDECSRLEILDAWRQAVLQRVGWKTHPRPLQGRENSEEKLMLLIGQDAAFAAPLAKKFVTVGGVILGIQEAINSHIQAALKLRPFDEGSPLAQSHKTRYPIVQGPMARVSDVPTFALNVAEGGALPFLALAMMRGTEIKPLLEETKRLLGNKNWGVGILGFVHPKLHAEQIEIIRNFRPPFVLIAGGRPDQGRVLEQEGIPTYFHVPSPGLLKMFIQNGVRRFVFEGRECGGHVGPRCSFVLWETMIDTLLESIPSYQQPPYPPLIRGTGPGGCPSNGDASDYHVLFAGGIHDALSASMVSVMAVPLAERGVCVGAQLGTAYLFTKEAVSSGAIVETFQQEAIKCDKTILLETALGHASRCINSSYAETFMKEKQRLESEGKSAEEIREALENMNLGRLRIAAKGINRNPQYGQTTPLPPFGRGKQEPRLVSLSEDEQRTSGMYMVGQVAALRDKVCAIKELHHDVAVESSSRLETQFARKASDEWRVTFTSHQSPVTSHHSSLITHHSSDIAIIGMACIMPKASDLQTYWENILNKVDAIIEVPKERWNWELYYDPDPRAKDKVYSKWGGFLDDIPFDPIKYGMPPNSLLAIEPLQLLTLEMVSAALKDAGYLERPFPRERTSVILGAGGGAADLGQKYGIRSALPTFFGDTSPEIMSHFEDVLPEWTEDSFAGILMNVAAGRVANRFNLGGENYTVDAACASSLAAVHLAAKELETGNSDMVIVGGADTMQGAFAYTCFSKTLALSPRGKCCTFDESADGIVLGEGIAILVLKRLADAERDGDKIYAVIKGVGASSDGRDKSMTAPRPEGQALALRRAYQKANISPATVELIEAHGTGTVVGDQAEIQALCQVFNAEMARGQDSKTARGQRCAIGSVKSMIGHTKCTAGVASLIKTALALHHKVLPPTLNVDKPNSKAKFEDSPFYVNTETHPWIEDGNGYPRRAGVSAFGFGGTNFHAVLEEYTDDYLNMTGNTAVLQEWPSELFLFSGNSRQEILESIESIEKALAHGAKPRLRDLAYTLSTSPHLTPGPLSTKRRGEGGEVRLALVATSLEDLHQKLIWAQKLLASLRNSTSLHPAPPAPLPSPQAPILGMPQSGTCGEGLGVRSKSEFKINDPRGIYYSEQPLAREGKVAFLFPGQGSQYINMLRDLAILFDEVRTCFGRANRVLHQNLSQPLSDYIFPPPTFSEEEERARQKALTQTNIAQPAIGAADMAMFHILETLGVKPDFVAGHSYGEYVALCAAGVFSEDVLIALSEARGRFIVESASPEPGTMAAVEADAQIVAEVIGEIDNPNFSFEKKSSIIRNTKEDKNFQLGIANLNAPKQTVISGYQAAVEQAVERFNARGIRARLIPVACAFHSPVVAAAKKRLAEFLSNVELSEPKIEVFSNTTAESYPLQPKAIADQLAEHLVSPVVFITEIEALYKAGARIFVEVGPNSVLTRLVEQILSNRPSLIVSSDQKELRGTKQSGILQLHHLLGRLAAEGLPIKTERLYSGRTVRQLDLKNLEKETGLPSNEVKGQMELSPTTWLINGSRAKPFASLRAGSIKEASKPDEVISPVRLVVADDVQQEGKRARRQEGKTARRQEGEENGKRARGQVLSASESQQALEQMSSSSPPPEGQGWVGFLSPETQGRLASRRSRDEGIDSLPHKSQVTPVYSPNGVTKVMTQFQQMMNRFLDTQKNVMLTYLQDADSTVDIATHPQPIPRGDSALSAVPGGLRSNELRLRTQAGATFAAQEASPHRGDKRGAGVAQSEIKQQPLKCDSEFSGLETKPPSLSSLEQSSEDEFIGRRKAEGGSKEIIPNPEFEGKPERTEIPDEEELTTRLLQIVSERTGYPTEMLDLDLDLEADLGIDSIKRVEILGSFQEGYILSGRSPSAASEQQNVEMELEELAGRKTLRGIIDWIKSRMDSIRRSESIEVEQPKADLSRPVLSPPPEGPGVGHCPDEDGAKTEDGKMAGWQDGKRAIAPLPPCPLAPLPLDDGVVQRYTLTAVEEPINDQHQRTRSLPTNRVLVLTDDENGVAQTLAEKLRFMGHSIALVRMGEDVQEINQGYYTADIISPEAVNRLIDIIHRQQGPIGGLIHLLPLKAAIPFEEMNLKDFRERLRLEVKSLFYLTRALDSELRQASTSKDASDNGGGCLIAASAMGGTYSSVPIIPNSEFRIPNSNFPGQASVAGFLKTMAYEWPDVQIKVVDLNPDEPVSILADHLLQEITTEDGQVEVGYSNSSRFILQPTLSPVNKTEPAPLEIEKDWVIMVTGGARGITADVAIEFAKNYQPTLILVGRSSLPEPQESKETASLNSPQELKSAIMARMRREGQTVTPAQVEAAYTRLLRDREMKLNLAAMQSAGAKVHYYQVDVRDEQAFGNLIDEIYQTYGRLDGVIHGAGTIEDKLVRDKTPDSFDRVFDTKVESIFTLSRKLRPDSLKFLVIFSSVAGRFGNRGQSDYAAANEVYNKLAIYLDNRWPGRVVSVIWGPWSRPGGMVSQELEKQFAQLGLELVPRSVGPRKLIEELRYGRKGEAEVILGGGGWENLKEFGIRNSEFGMQTFLSKEKSPLGRGLGVGNQKKQEESQFRNPKSEIRNPKQIRVPLLVNSGLQLPDERVLPSVREDGAFVIVKNLDPAFDLYLQHHQLDGKPVLPMAFALELMAETASLCWSELELAEISDLRALRGIVLDNGPKSIQVIAKPIRNSEFGIRNSELKVEFSIESVSENPKRIYYQATANLAKELSEAKKETYESLILKEKRSFPMDIEEAYQQWLFHGPILQSITQIEGIGDNGIIASLVTSSPEKCLTKALPTSPHPPAPLPSPDCFALLATSACGEGLGVRSWIIDPVIVDCSFQLTILWGRMYWDMTSLPSRFSSYKRFGELNGNNISCQVCIRPDSKGKGHESLHAIHADVAFIGEDGRLLGLLEGLEHNCSKSLNRLTGIT